MTDEKLYAVFLEGYRVCVEKYGDEYTYLPIVAFATGRVGVMILEKTTNHPFANEEILKAPRFFKRARAVQAIRVMKQIHHDIKELREND